jgi:hypothetical protein
MLRIVVPGEEYFNNEKQEFYTLDDTTLELEHSLISLSKWESEFKQPFLGTDQRTPEQVAAYIKAMILTPDISDKIVSRMSKDNFEDINNYIDSRESATTFNEIQERPRGRSEIITSELIYYWMVAFTIPFECETWHLNRLFNLIRICSIKNSKQKSMPKNELARRNRDLNEQRKAQLGTTG